LISLLPGKRQFPCLKAACGARFDKTALSVDAQDESGEIPRAASGAKKKRENFL